MSDILYINIGIYKIFIRKFNIRQLEEKILFAVLYLLIYCVIPRLFEEMYLIYLKKYILKNIITGNS